VHLNNLNDPVLSVLIEEVRFLGIFIDLICKFHWPYLKCSLQSDFNN